jgi:hypothetical protein
MEMVNTKLKSLMFLSFILLGTSFGVSAGDLWRKYRSTVATVAVVGAVGTGIYYWWNSNPEKLKVEKKPIWQRLNEEREARIAAEKARIAEGKARIAEGKARIAANKKHRNDMITMQPKYSVRKGASSPTKVRFSID